MSKKVSIEKTGSITLVTVSYSGNDVCKEVYSISSANLSICKDEVKVCLGCGKELGFKLEELVNDFGVNTLYELLILFANLNYFTNSGLGSSGFVSLDITSNSSTVQSDLLIGKQSINMVVINNVITQNILGYNSVSGQFNFEVLSGERLLVFFTN